MLFCLLLLLMNGNIIANPEDCCPRSNNLIKAIDASNFPRVTKILKNAEIMPLSSEGAKERSITVRAQRLERIKKPNNVTDSVKFTCGLLLIGASVFNAFNLFVNRRTIEQHVAEWPVDLGTACSSIFTAYQGSKLVLDSIFKWQEYNDLAHAIAVEQTIKEFETERP